uniref:RRM domain-containing protein n=1 Tax=Pygocentrus nattereri TaxID=42514 RepID=A0AAR2KZ26_PYGNA
MCLPGDFPHPLTVEGPWPSASTKTLDAKLQIYFQSRRKSQGGDCVVRFSEQSRTATVHFRSAESEMPVSVQPYGETFILSFMTPVEISGKHLSCVMKVFFFMMFFPLVLPSVEPDESQRDPPEECPKSSAVVLENVPQTFSREALLLLVENISGHSEKEFSLEIIRELGRAVVTFNDPNGIRSNTIFQQCSLSGRALEKSRSVKVENVPAEASKELLYLYFERWGGQVKDIITSPEEQAAIITFHGQEGKKFPL